MLTLREHVGRVIIENMPTRREHGTPELEFHPFLVSTWHRAEQTRDSMMAEPHIIRLRGPWELEPLARYVAGDDGSFREETRNLPAGGRVSAPSDWGELLGRDFIGRARYARRFNRPTNLEPAERVWLALDGVDPRADVALNGQPLGQANGYQTTTRFDITAALGEHNVLAVEVSMPVGSLDDEECRPGRAGLPGGLIGEVRLEIGRSHPGVEG